MGTPYDSVNYWSPMNYDSIAADKWYQWASQSPNVNFKGTNTVSSPQATTNTTSVSAAQTTNNGAIPVNYSETKPDESNTGLWVAGTIGAAALIACMAKGGGNPIKGAKAWYEKLFKSAGGKGTSNLKNTVLTKMQAVKNGNGEIKLNVPNQTKTFVGTNINSGVNEYGIKGAISAERQAFNPKSEAFAMRGFQVNANNKRYTVFMKDGQVSKIVEGYRTNVTESVDSELKNKIIKMAEELAKNPKDADKGILKDVINIGYVNRYGDDTLKLTMGKYGETPQLKSLRTLRQFNKNDVPVLQYVPSESEKIFNNELTKQDSFLGVRFGQKALVDGVKVISVPPTEIAGVKCFFEGDKLVKIVENGNPYEAGSNGFIQFVQKNEKAIEEFRKDVFVDKIYDKIPTGSIIA